MNHMHETDVIVKKRCLKNILSHRAATPKITTAAAVLTSSDRP